jgi:hypothetical protein
MGMEALARGWLKTNGSWPLFVDGEAEAEHSLGPGEEMGEMHVCDWAEPW